MSATDRDATPQDIPPVLREALLSVRAVMRRRVMRRHTWDWVVDPDDAWIALIMCWHGDTPGGDALLSELATRHGWTPADLHTIDVYRRAVAAALTEPPARGPEVSSREEAADILARESRSPRYAGKIGRRLLLDHPETVEHAYRAAQAANPGQGPDYLAKLTAARNLLRTQVEGNTR